uniref:Uncharacterized protein n=1 Tax=Salix viminalis TaxID=40686 RepID=A0A6N2L4V1_SALVM
MKKEEERNERKTRPRKIEGSGPIKISTQVQIIPPRTVDINSFKITSEIPTEIQARFKNMVLLNFLSPFHHPPS